MVSEVRSEFKVSAEVAAVLDAADKDIHIPVHRMQHRDAENTRKIPPRRRQISIIQANRAKHRQPFRYGSRHPRPARKVLQKAIIGNLPNVIV